MGVSIRSFGAECGTWPSFLANGGPEEGCQVACLRRDRRVGGDEGRETGLRTRDRHPGVGEPRRDDAGIATTEARCVGGLNAVDVHCPCPPGACRSGKAPCWREYFQPITVFTRSFRR